MPRSPSTMESTSPSSTRSTITSVSAEFSVGDFELYYRMHQRAGRAIKAVLEGNVEEPVRNEAAFRLARIQFQKDQPQDALHALERISGEIPEDIRDDIEFLRANIYMAIGRPSDAADVLRTLAGLAGAEGLLDVQPRHCAAAGWPAARSHRAARPGRAGGQPATSPRSRSGTSRTWFSAPCCSNHPSSGRRKRSLDRVRLEGPFSNQALLRAGWADVSAQNFQRALVPWSILAEREPTDAAVQEALLALPFAYSKVERAWPRSTPVRAGRAGLRQRARTNWMLRSRASRRASS